MFPTAHNKNREPRILEECAHLTIPAYAIEPVTFQLQQCVIVLSTDTCLIASWNDKNPMSV